jgi:uncharacterized membrane protein YjfL (UPF0719 family)
MEFLQEYLEVSNALDALNFRALGYLGVALLCLVIGKFINDLLTPYKLNSELADKDNKALAVSYTGYLVAQGIIILGVLLSPGGAFVHDMIMTAIWCIVGIILLNIARFLNDKLILGKFDNVKEIIKDRNVGTGAVQMGGYLGIAFIIKAIVQGESEGIVPDLVGTLIFFVAAQVCFVVFGIVYQKVTSYDIHKEIENDNVAAGVSFGMSLMAIGLILSRSIEETNSLAALGVWFVNGLALIILSRFLVDKLILPGHKLDDEIQKDRNWGVALIEGGTALVIAFIINASF